DSRTSWSDRPSDQPYSCDASWAPSASSRRDRTSAGPSVRKTTSVHGRAVAVLLLRIGLARLSPRRQVEPTSHAGCQAAEDPRIGGERERNSSEIVHTHPGHHRYRRDLDDVDRTLTDDVASQNVVGCAVDDQLAEPVRPSVDDRAGGGI